MPLTAGAKLGPYEILSPLGAGGMGEVYRARDTKLGRDVALKVLPEQFAGDPERMGRFAREAQVLASLNHPNIASIYGLEDSGKIRALVMELVEGLTLAERLAVAPVYDRRTGSAKGATNSAAAHRAALQLDEALPIAKQIAEALEYAHEKGIIHRDLKPANVKVTRDGAVKVLDFGLAKALEVGAIHESPLQDSPTLTQAATQAGVILGTAAYISPEQARGKPVDRRADIWAFGCVLYEMLVGERAFAGETTSDVLAAVIRAEPDFAALPASTPLRIRDLLVRSLNKDPKSRLRDIGEARIAIEETLSGAADVGAIHESPLQPATMGTSPLQLTRFRALPWALLAALSVGVALWSFLRAPSPPARPVARLAVTLPSTDRLAQGFLSPLALAPDGSRLVYVAHHGAGTQLYVRALDSFDAKPIPGTEGAENPFFPPDAQSVGFFAEGKMKKISLSGGAPFTLCDAASNRGATWVTNNKIVFTPSGNSGLYEISADGGTPKPLTVPERQKGEISHRYPHILPGGKALLFTLWSGGSFDDARIVSLSLETGERQVLVEGGTYAQYVPPGYVVYARAGALLAVPFDLKRLALTGPPVPILEGISMDSGTGSADFSVSAGGDLAYVPGGLGVVLRNLVWVNRKGVTQPLAAPPHAYFSPRISPDGRRVAVGDNISDLWLFDLTREALTRLADTSGAMPLPIWTPDGHSVTFRSVEGASLNIHWMPADASRAPERLTTGENQQSPGSWSPDGRVLAFTENDPTTGWDIWVLKLEGDRKPRPFLKTPFNEGAPEFSPDGHWLAYQSDESGRLEVYVQPFPGPGAKSQISTEGGMEPMWARNGRELFYRNGDKMMAVTVETKATFAAAKPKLLFEGPYERGSLVFSFEPNYDVSPDGQRFLMVKASAQESSPPQINIVLNWFEDLKRRVPTGK
jgi:eukaryotic-like serine/threonine-protein kinase